MNNSRERERKVVRVNRFGVNTRLVMYSSRFSWQVFSSFFSLADVGSGVEHLISGDSSAGGHSSETRDAARLECCVMFRDPRGQTQSEHGINFC